VKVSSAGFDRFNGLGLVPDCECIKETIYGNVRAKFG